MGNSASKRSLAARVAPDPSGLRELTLASRLFRKRAHGNLTLKQLLLIDPLRAFREVDIEVSKRARKAMRRLHPELNFDDGDLYDRVKGGEPLPWVEGIILGPRDREDPHYENSDHLSGTDNDQRNHQVSES